MSRSNVLAATAQVRYDAVRKSVPCTSVHTDQLTTLIDDYRYLQSIPSIPSSFDFRHLEVHAGAVDTRQEPPDRAR